MSRNNIRTYKYRCWLVVIMALSNGLAAAQTETLSQDSISRRNYALVAYVGGGFSRFVGAAGTPPGFNTSLNKNGVAGTLRFMWHPDRRVRFGIESGWTSFYKYQVNGGTNAAKVNLTGIPILLVFSMPVTKQLSLFAGAGTYWETSYLDYVGKVKSNRLSIGYMASAMYVVPISERISLASELKWFNATETKDSALSLQLMAIWKFYQW